MPERSTTSCSCAPAIRRAASWPKPCSTGGHGQLPRLQRRQPSHGRGQPARARTAAAMPARHDGPAQEELGRVRASPTRRSSISSSPSATTPPARSARCGRASRSPRTGAFADPAAATGSDDRRSQAFRDALPHAQAAHRAVYWRCRSPSSTGWRIDHRRLKENRPQRRRNDNGEGGLGHVRVRTLSDPVGRAVHRGRHRARPSAAAGVPGDRRRRDRPGQSAGRAADLADDHADAGEDRLRRAAPGARALARHRRHAVRQLGGEAVLDGAARLAVHRPSVPRPICRRTRSTATSPA